ncbi:glutathione transport system permease protein GsiC [Abditibacteriota bacterium]|nr:glutathione transport system permease protein GsiC [Abditibacteriota bacterium]
MLSFGRKALGSLVTLWGVTVVLFALIFIVPGIGQKDPTDSIAQSLAGAHADKENIENIKHQLGLDKPLLFRYGIFVRDAATNNLRSYRNGDYVFSAIARRFPATLLLALTALTVYLAVAIPLSLLTASRSGSFFDRAFLVLSLLAISIPTFWLGRILQQYLGFQLGLFSVGGTASLWNLPLPALTLGIGGAAYYSRLLHTNLRGVMRQEYIRAARARGLSEARVLSKHALKNALIPAIAVLGGEVASLLSGLVFTEKIFGWPGIGSLAIDSVLNQDTPMIMGTVLFSALMVVSANLIVDVLYRIVDPRIRA